MNKSKGWSSLPGKLLILTLVFALLTGLFYWVVAEDWRRSAVETDMVSASGLAPLKEGAENRVTQGFTVQMDRLTALRLIPGRMRLEPAGEIGLRQVARHDGLRIVPQPREKHLHLLECRVLRLVEDDERIVERASAHII